MLVQEHPREVASLALDFTPIVGQLKGAAEAGTSVNWVTGEKLSELERGLALASILPYGAIVKVGKLAKGAKIVEGVVDGVNVGGWKELTIRTVEGKTVNPFLREGAEFSVRLDESGKRLMSIDTSIFVSGEKTLNGGIRNAKKFWKEWAQQFGETISVENLARINDRPPRSPLVDDHWIKYYPEHTPYKGQSLIHHHLDYGSHAIPLPQGAHALQPGWAIWHQ